MAAAASFAAGGNDGGGVTFGAEEVEIIAMDPGTGKPRSVRTRIATPFVNPSDAKAAAGGGVSFGGSSGSGGVSFGAEGVEIIAMDPGTGKPRSVRTRIATPFVNPAEARAGWWQRRHVVRCWRQ